MAMGTSWEEDSWTEDSWETGSWADLGAGGDELDGVIVATLESTNPTLSVVSTNPVLTVTFTS